MTKKTNILLKNLALNNIDNIYHHSGTVTQNSIFVAIPCSKVVEHIQEAIAKGARMCLLELATYKQYNWAQEHTDVNFVVVDNARHTLALLAKYQYKSQPEFLVAVTGTNGKTSVTEIYRQLLMLNKYQVASMGTLGVKSDVCIDELKNLPHLTTLGPLDFYKTLCLLSQNNINYVAMEASSHGLHQYRLHGAHIRAAGWTNLSQDHLDYHGTMTAYKEAKFKLFKEILPHNQPSIINIDDHAGYELASYLKKQGRQVISYSLKHTDCDLAILQFTPQGERGYLIKLKVFDSYYEDIYVPLLGEFQLYNLMCALGLAYSCDIDMKKLIASIPHLKPIIGRLDFIGYTHTQASVFIDFAHTPDALENTLKTLGSTIKGHIWLVFGCGGNRDSSKRLLMGQIAHKYAHNIIITDDNPRHEEPHTIRSQIKQGCPDAKEIASRTQAIEYALTHSKAHDCIIIAGKGHETGQIYGDDILPFSDHEVVKKNIKENS